MPIEPSMTAALVQRQRKHFESGATRSRAAREAALDALRRALVAAEPDLLDALRSDLGKPAAEAYASELGSLLAELDHTRRHLGRWMRPARRRTPWIAQPGTSHIVPEPRGVTLVLSPWNYPLLLSLAPTVASLAAGNTVVVKPSETAPRTAAALERILAAALPPEHATVLQGGAETAESLLAQRFDHIFFTGGTAIGQRVAAAAARALTPCTLELGGKSPCIVCADADLRAAARRIAWGKFLNAGQTCVAPDTVWVQRTVAEDFLADLQGAITAFYGTDPRQSPDFARIVSEAHCDRLAALLDVGRLVCGGTVDRAVRYVAPTVLTDLPADAPILREEVFGPILPVVPFDDLDTLLADLRDRPTPLALYVFARRRATQDHVLARTRSGSACVNDTVLQILNPRLPFGGLGPSGWGAYHGRSGFDTFSHARAVLRRGAGHDPAMRFPPFRTGLPVLRRVLPWLLR